jgi:hypothetical protein
MTKRNAVLAVLVAGMICGISYGQQAARQQAGGDDLDRGHAHQEEAVYDDDGGRVFIVRRQQSPLESLIYHGGPIISEPRQYTIFMGEAWAGAANKARKASLSDLMSGLDQASMNLLQGREVKTSSWTAASREERQEFSDGSAASDLKIQAALSDMFERGSIRGPDPNTIYVVFLAPGIQSTLGEMFGGKHYVAYHNFFHLNEVQVHYVVAPFEMPRKSARSAATRALIDAILNPSGNGWY